MQYKTAALFAVGLASSAAATGWLDEDAYSVPSNTDNKCSEQQQGGYDWSGLDEGSFSSYGSNSFSGFSCGQQYGKRDLLTKRTFQSKCIQGNLYEQPSMSCDSDDDKMSIDEMEISTSHDADVECEYSMPDGSTCRETHSCSSGGQVVKNSQCGGARSVTFKPGKNAPSDCSVGVHSIGFNCNPAPSSIPSYTSSTVMTPGYTSRTMYTSSAPAPSCAYGDDDCSESATPSSPVSSSAPAPSCAYGDYECSASATPSSPVSSAPAPSCAYGDEDCSSSATPSSPVSSSAPAPSCAYGDYECSASSSAPATTATPGYTSRCSEGEDCESSSTPSSPETSSAPAPSCAYGDEDCSETPSSPVTTSEIVETSSAPAPSCAYGDEDCSATPSSPATTSKPAESSAPAPSCAYGECDESSTVATPGYTDKTSSTENSPVGSTSVPGYGGSTGSVPGSPATSSAPYPTSSKPAVPTYGTGSTSSATENSPVSSSSTQQYPEPSCPGVLPKCLKTWLHVSDCKDSGDSDCFCKNHEFIKNVHECLPAWASNEEASAAASYLMGLCAPHVPENPGIITNCPSSITPVATPSKTPSAPVSSAPVESVSSASEWSPVQSSVPAEVSSSSPGSPVESVTPPAYTPSTHTYWSTAEITVTSCGPEVTDCPASSTVVQTTSTQVVTVETTPASSTPYSPVTSSPAGSPPGYSAPAESAPVESAPAESAPVESAPAGSAPGYSAPAPSAPVGSAPAGSPPGYSAPGETPYSPVTTNPAGSPPGYSAPAGSAPAGSAPAGSAPGAPSAPGYTAPPAETAPMTTVTYSSSVIAPATYTEGVSQGYEIPDSSYTTHLVTTITVPQVALTTVTVTSNGQETTSVSLGAGSPAPASATPTADAVGGQAPAYGTGSAGWGTSYIPKPTASGTAPIEQVGNSGNKVGSSLAGLALGAVAVVMAL